MHDFPLAVEQALVFEPFDYVVDCSVRWRTDHDFSVILCLLQILVLRGKKTHECRSLSRSWRSLQQDYALFSEHHLSNRLELRLIEDLLEVLEDVIEAILVLYEGF